MTKININNFWEPTPKKIKRIAWAIKGFTGSIGAGAIVADYKWVGLSILIIGAVCDAVLEFFKEEDEV